MRKFCLTAFLPLALVFASSVLLMAAVNVKGGDVYLGNTLVLKAFATGSLPTCNTAADGSMVWDSTTHQEKVCNGGAWQATAFSPVVSDTFSDGDGPMVWPWKRIPTLTIPNIATGKAGGAGMGAYYAGATFSANHFAQAQISVAADSSANVMVRQSPSAVTSYMVTFIDDTSGTGNTFVRAYRSVNGALTQLGTITNPAATWLRIEVTGTSVVAKYGTDGTNWSTLGTYTDANIATGAPGFSTGANSTVDNFTAGNL